MTDAPARAAPLTIGGWLVLLGVGIVLAPFLVLLNLTTLWRDVFASGAFDIMSDTTSPDYDPLWPVVLVGELAFQVMMFLATLLLAASFFRRKWAFPRLYLGVNLMALTANLVDIAAVRHLLPELPLFDGATVQTFASLAISLLIWTPYLFLSDRARRTFIA